MRETHAANYRQEPTTTDLAQVARMAEALHRPAYQWDGNKFVHIGGPEIANINHLRRVLSQDMISKTEGVAA